MTMLSDPAVEASAIFVGRIESVDVWRGRLDIEPSELNGAWALLSADERQRAHAYRSEELQRRFVARRGLLRQLLSDRLELPPHCIDIRLNKGDKPYIEGEPIQFSLSHSFDSVLFAFSREYRVGVDLERVREGYPAPVLVSDHFTALERASLDHAAPLDRSDLFFRLWTRKEACAKALGTGIATSLSRFQVLNPAGLHPLKIHDLELDADHRAALCIAPC